MGRGHRYGWVWQRSTSGIESISPATVACPRDHHCSAGRLGVAILLGASLARAAPPGQTDATDAQPTRSVDYYWDRTDPGPFVAGYLEGGVVARSVVAVGYGRPHWQWLGLQGEVVFTPSFAQRAATVLAVVPFAKLAATATETGSFFHGLAAPEDEVTAPDLTTAPGPTTHYRTLGVWGSLYIPIGGWLTWIYASADRIYGITDQRLLFDEVRTAVVRLPWAESVLVAELRCLGETCQHRFGLASEAIHSSRGTPTVLRLGAAYTARFGPRTSALVYMTWPVRTPDDLGWLGAGGSAALRYAWSTREPR